MSLLCVEFNNKRIKKNNVFSVIFDRLFVQVGRSIPLRPTNSCMLPILLYIKPCEVESQTVFPEKGHCFRYNLDY